MTTKVLILGRVIPHQDNNCTGQQLCDGFKQAGYDAHFYGWYHDNTHRIVGREHIDQAKSFDLVVYTEMNDGMPQYNILLDQFDCPKLYWDFDCSYNFDFALRRARMYDFDGYLVGNYKYLEAWRYQFKNKPIIHLPYAFSRHRHHPDMTVSKTHLLGFVGSMTPEREKLLDGLECDIDIANGIYAEDLVNRTNQHYAVLHQNQVMCEGLVPMRPWETMGCGSCLLMDETSYEDFTRYILEHNAQRAIFKFSNKDDIIAWVDTFNSEEGKLDLISRGLDLSKYGFRHHSYASRAKSIIDWCQDIGLL